MKNMLNTDMTRLKLVVLSVPKGSKSSAQVLTISTKKSKKRSLCGRGIAQLTPGFWSGIRPVVGICINHLIWRAVEPIIRAILPEPFSIEIRRRDANQGKQGNGNGELEKQQRLEENMRPIL